MKLKQNGFFMLAAWSLLLSAKSGAVTFDTSLLAGASRESDLSRFYENSDMPAGSQEMDIYVNDNWQGRYVVEFGQQKDEVSIAWEDAARLGIDMRALHATPADTRLPLNHLVQGGRVHVDAPTLSIRLTVPQAYTRRLEPGYVDPQFWSEGVPALLLSYNMTYYNTHLKDDGASSDDFYTGLESGVNLFGWQLRDNSSWRKASGDSGHWQNNTRFLRRPIAAIKSNLTLGDFYSPGDLFDSLRMRGVALASDMNMRPDSQRGFSPVVRGVARTSALVKVIQNGNVIYQENVPPGQFMLDSIQPTGSAGDLLVVVREADGAEQSFRVPFSAVPGMLKEGVSQYSLVAGKIHQTNVDDESGFAQGTLRYGISNLVTGYAGAIGSSDYSAGLLGTGWNLPIGAVSVDVTHAKTTIRDRSDSGQSFRIAWSKFLDYTGTNFTLAAYRYSTKGYYSFSDALYSRANYRRLTDRYQDVYGPGHSLAELDLYTLDALRNARPRNTFTLNMNQRLADGWGTVFFSGTRRDYWTSGQASREYQAGYSGAIGRTNYTLSVSRVRNSSYNEETRFYASLSLPFTLFDNSAWLTTSLSTTEADYEQSNVSLSGTALASNRLNYSLSGSNQRGGDNMASANVAYRSRFSTLGGSYSEGSDYRQAGLSARGSAVAVPWHVLASNEMGSTMTVVVAPQAAGRMVNGDRSIMTNQSGLALVPYATPYRKNVITLSDTDISEGATLVGNIANTAPYEGAVNLVRFETDSRRTWVLRAVRANGTPLPFGTEVFNEHGASSGFVGQASVLYVMANEKPQRLTVRMRDESCTISAPNFGLDNAQAVCR